MGPAKPIDQTRSLFTGIGRPLLVTRSPAMIQLINDVKALAPRFSIALIEGESGTGKELIARALHANSPRRDRPFIAINGSAIAESLLESELFGHLKGAFSGAHADKVGLAEAAHGGTLFIDDANLMSPAMQAKILRLLQEMEILPVGATEARKVDIVIIAASNQDLSSLANQGRFRSDLYYRLKVAFLRVPPLRNRLEDLRPLFEGFLADYGRKHNLPIPEVPDDVYSLLVRHPWVGNVRELENSIGTFYTAVREGRVDVDHIRNYLSPVPLCAKEEIGQPNSPRSDAERKRAEEALRLCGGNKRAAARLLGVHWTTLYIWLKKWGLI